MSTFDRVRMTTATTGAGAITLGAAVAGFRSFAAANVPSGEVVTYTIEDGSAWEVGEGTYSAGPGTLTRSLVSSSTGSLLNLTGSASVFLTARAELLGYPGSPAYEAALFTPCAVEG